MKELNIEIITPTKVAYSGRVKTVTIPGTAGSFQILYNHAPIISTFEVGRIKIGNENGDESEFATGGGSVEVKNNKVLILADSFESKSEIDIERAQNALQRAQKRIAIRNKEEIDLVKVEAALARAINRIKFANSYSSS